jgi:hypothetical protein
MRGRVRGRAEAASPADEERRPATASCETIPVACHQLPVCCRLGAAGPLASPEPWLSVGNRLNLRLPCVFRVPCPRQAVESRLAFSLQVRVSWCRSHRSSPTSGPGMASLPSASAYAGLCVRSPTRSTRTLARQSRLAFSLQVRVSWCRAHRSSPTSGPGMASLPLASAYAGLCVRSPTRSTRTLARHICHATSAGCRAARPPTLL